MKPRIVRLFIKPYCPWCHEAIEWLDRQHWQYERLDVTNDSAAHKEMVALSGQSKAPTIEIDGKVLADFDTRELEKFLATNGYAA